MASQTEKAKTKLSALSSSFDDLESLLDPLFAQTLPETILALEPIQQAKLQTVLPYLVYDLVFIYLKSRGIDPKTHPVVSELDRVKEYFGKVSNAENPPAKRAEVDKGAAQRFIKHAITQATYGKAPEQGTPGPSLSSTQVQAKITSKMLERQLYEKKLREEDAQEIEEEVLEVYEDTEDTRMDVDTIAPKSTKKGKGKAKEVPSTPTDSTSQPIGKRRRPAVDPFAGYGDDVLSTPIGDASQANARSSKKRTLYDGTTESPADTPAASNNSNSNSPAPGSGETKKVKKAKKKSRKSLPTSSR
ncbi:Nuclear nucleic acid-binding protein C1D [Hypsizygus marmoreus]|uniref:Exosome complex protein n=1 Tax=Hypsizygus marmoreus TaxID=39966 RepID=A0A369KFB7_HYPMA|nr:Nuclear nucleic acid-binding protein C1D [Hypsizygus marmoreus]